MASILSETRVLWENYASTELKGLRIYVLSKDEVWPRLFAPLFKSEIKGTRVWIRSLFRPSSLTSHNLAGPWAAKMHLKVPSNLKVCNLFSKMLYLYVIYLIMVSCWPKQTLCIIQRILEVGMLCEAKKGWVETMYRLDQAR